MKPPLRFHWSLLPGESWREADTFIELCHRGEQNGVESIDVPGAGSMQDTLALATTAGMRTTSIRFRIGCDPDGISPALSAQQVKQAGTLLGSRLFIHMKVGSMEKGLEDTRFALACEFFSNCREIFKESEAPEMHVEGDSAEAAFLAIKHADCLWRLPNRPDQVYGDALPVLHFGKEVGMVSSIIARATRAEALEAAKALPGTDSIESWDDPAAWITPYLRIGGLPGCGPKTVAMVGSFEELAQAVHGFKKKGISQFLFRGYPDEEEMTYFGAGVLPIIRALEGARGAVE